MFKKIFDHVNKYKHWWVWTPLIPIGLLVLGKITVWLNLGRPLVDDINSVFGNALEAVPIILSAILAATIVASDTICNSLNQEQYAAADWKNKLVDNAPGIILLLAFLLHFHTHG